MLTMDQGCITCRQTPLPPALRLFSGFLGIGIGTVIPAAWISNVTAATPAPVLLLVALVTAVSVASGVFLIGVGLVSVTELRIDPLGAATRIRRGPLLNDSVPIPRSAFGPPEVVMHDSEDGPFPILRLPVQGHPRMEFTCFDTRAEAEAWRDVIARALRA